MNITRAAVLSGTNLGNRYDNLTEAQALLEEKLGKAVAVSQVFETQAWGGKSTHDYLNQVLLFETSGNARSLLEACLKTELEMGRVRTAERWTDRLIDLDVLFFGNQVIGETDLQLPHPRMAERRFVLVPLASICPNWRHPILAKTTAELLAACSDDLQVQLYKEVSA